LNFELQTLNFLSWLKKGSLAVIDQGLFSGANFIVNILLARWLTPEEYGAFAVAMSVFYLLAGFHTAVLTEPMMVFGAGKYREQFRKYLGMLLWGHWAISALIALALGIAAFVMARLGSAAMVQALAGLAIASPFLLLLWLTRRACYADLRPAWAVVGSALNLLAILAGLFLLWRAELLSTLTGLVLLGAAAGVASLALTTLHLRPRVWRFAGNPTPAMVLGDHLRYGGWSTGTTLLSSLSLNLYFILLPLLMNLEAIATLRALYNLVVPVQQAINSLSPLLLVYMSRRATYSDLRKPTLRASILFGVGSALYFVFLVAFGKWVIFLLYAGKYSSVSGLLVFVGLYPLLTAQSVVFGSSLRSSLRVAEVFSSYFTATFIFLVLGIPSVVVLGLTGAVVGLLIYGISLVAALAIKWRYANASSYKWR